MACPAVDNNVGIGRMPVVVMLLQMKGPFVLFLSPKNDGLSDTLYQAGFHRAQGKGVVVYQLTEKLD